MQGTNLWKANKRDDAYELYNSTTVSATQKLVSKELRQPLVDALNVNKIQVINLAAKAKGAVTLRKALDKFLADSQEVSILYCNVSPS